MVVPSDRRAPERWPVARGAGGLDSAAGRPWAAGVSTSSRAVPGGRFLQRTAEDLARDLRQRREAGDPMPVLLLGAGASLDSGVGVMGDLYRYVGCKDFAGFTDVIGPLTSGERYRLLARFLQAVEPEAVTPGYAALADLLAARFLDVVLTTNLDPLLDDALSAARLKRKDFLLLVNGLVVPARLAALLSAGSPRVKVVKLHGDLLYRCMAWTPEEMRGMVEAVAEPLRRVVASRDLVVVGHSLRDDAIRDLVDASGETVWFVDPAAPPAFLARDPRVRVVTGTGARFEALFPTLARELEVATGPQPRAADDGVGTTLDDATAALVGVVGPSGPMATGVVLGDPRVVLVDAYPVRATGQQDPLRLAWSGTEGVAPVLADLGPPFGPLATAVPGHVTVPGLRLDPSPLRAGEAVHVAVAVGERTGISSGHVVSGHEVGLDVAPVGRVEGLVELAVATAPGSSGAPVLNEDMAVRAMVVAGGGHRTFVAPASRWAAHLTAALAEMRDGP